MSIRIGDIPETFVHKMKGPVPTHEYASDGCTLVPDILFGVDVRIACLFHDYLYHKGGNKKDRRKADLLFFYNLSALGLSPFWASLYYVGARVFGIATFNWQKDYPHPLIQLGGALLLDCIYILRDRFSRVMG